MRLWLKRKPSSRGNLGALYLGNKRLCLTRESPLPRFQQGTGYLGDGIYPLGLIHTESEGWKIQVGELGWIVAKAPDRSPASGEISPVTFFRTDGMPMFTQLAFLKLLDELGSYWERGEILELEVSTLGIPYALESCRTPQYS